MSKKTDRLNRLIDIIKTKNGASIKELAAMLGVSEMTIRRDLDVLEQHSIVNSVYGAAIYNPTSDNPTFKGKEGAEYSIGIPYEVSNAKSAKDAEKKSIGSYAASLINPGDIIVIDSGSTTEMLAEYVPDDTKATILCYNANILNSLRLKENLTLIFSGGKYHPKTQMVESFQGVELIKSMRFTKAFISAAGVHASLGITCVYDYEVPTKLAIMQSSVEKILIFDSSKFNQVKPAYIGSLTDFNTIITDDKIPEEWKELIQSKNIKLHIVPTQK
ncbi:DeoR/GlpR family DNA-binding transcription regulator [Anaerocolumna xylanovorans]|uniref:Transcriptional regulator, DeoR family n=1 Tax=Anaerocolumna xylanovorans DSM 12503 TaxID=1121345 RepID=A0A1M7Y7W8_9FIRM|nr:DeoR/GlpR family DNA-binding transcription regulator [Anaerocolumna xylanovorans]SHO48717.1 transcriptional regulator, DeoR family [Anaerocolumna xylanovorans DSM 12503]